MSALDRARPGDALSCPAEDFLDLLCGQEDLLDVEFEAIITANWPDAPQPPSLGEIGGGGHGGEPPHGSGPLPPELRGGCRRAEVWSRQRSPPRNGARVTGSR